MIFNLLAQYYLFQIIKVYKIFIKQIDMSQNTQIKQQTEDFPQFLKNINAKQLLIKIAKLCIWLTGLYGCCFISMEKIYFIGSAFYFIFTNLGKRKEGQMSAYSVFNKGFKKLPGTFSADQMIKGRHMAQFPSQNKDQKLMDQDQLSKAKNIDQYFKNQSKYGNKSCYCGSQLKFKKCCLPRKKQQEQQQRKRKKTVSSKTQ